ncbi:MAG: hypothetical protein KGI25_03615 [Thaumarchaeota archaeon]|nr:hypothetical protein [Nitrososphaerota archaeon]
MDPNALTLSQLAQRIDELEHLLDKPDTLNERLDNLKSHYERKTKNEFNKAVVTPVPPDKIDFDNPSVISPKAPDLIDREQEQWEKSLE